MGIINRCGSSGQQRSRIFTSNQSTKSRSVDLAARRQGATVEEVALGAHKVGITSEGGLRVEPGQDLLEEISGLLVVAAVHGAVESKLGKPDLLDTALLSKVDGLGNEGLEILGIVAVPVDADASNVAVGACVHERLQPVEALAGAPAVGNRRTEEGGFAGVGGDILVVRVGGVGGRHAGLAVVVGLVEAQDVFATAGEGGLDGRPPAAEHLATPEHGDELDTLGDKAHGKHVPVEGPGDSMRDRLNQGHIVVGSTTLVVGALGVSVVFGMRGSQSGGCHEAGGDQFGEADHCVAERV